MEEMPAEVLPLVEWARAMKGDLVAERSAGENDDLRPTLDFRRGADDDPVALVFCPNVDRDEALQAASIGVPGWGVDHLIMVIDAHHSDEKFVERYGRVPDPLELQDLCDNEGACELGIITDAILVTETWRSGRQRLINLPYHVHKTARTVHWIEDERYACIDTEVRKGVELGGILFNNLRRFFSVPPLRDDPKLDPAEFGLDPDGPEVEIHKDLAIMRVLAGSGFGVGFNAPTPLHQELLNKTLEHAHGLELHGDDGTVRRSDATPDALAVLNELLRRKLADERKEIHERELAERNRRRAARGEEAVGRSLQDIFNELTNGR